MFERLTLKEKILGGITLLMIVIGLVTWASRALHKTKMPALPVVPLLAENPLAAIFTPPAPPQEKIRGQKSKRRQAWGRDPFSKLDIDNMPLPAEGMDLNSFVLTGIIQRGAKRVAILNRLFVHEGDDIQGIIVLRIDQDRVVLKKGDEEATVKMGAV